MRMCHRTEKRALKIFQMIKTHSSVSEAKKAKKTCVLFTGTAKLPNSAFCMSKTTKPISTKYSALHIHYFTYQN